MSKRLFWRLFKLAFEKAFTKKNINSAFEKAGIWLFNPDQVLGQLQQRRSIRLSLISSPNHLGTPKSCRTVRRVHKAYKIDPKLETLAKILRANEAFAA
jgi:hypothetical protein